MKTDIRKSKYISKLLRHDAEDLIMDSNGWVLTLDLLNKVGLTKEELDDIVENNNKKRFEFSDTMDKIRARQGHSMSVDVELKEIIPPVILYHGTASTNIKSILEDGLKKMNRLHVHLSDEVATATNVGSRHGSPIVLSVDTLKMYNEGFKFYKSNNGVYLTEHIPAKYIRLF